MVERGREKSRTIRDLLSGTIDERDVHLLVEELKKMAPPLEILADEEIESIEKASKILAAKAESYYLGYLRAQAQPGGEVADAGVTILAATTGSVVGTVVGQIVGKKLDKTVNIREHVINPELFKFENIKKPEE